jgi:hypothetical protein
MMRKKLQGMAVIAALLALAFAMVTVSCPDPTGGGGGGSTAVEGVWENTGGQKITFSGSSFTRITGGSLDYKGTFSVNASTKTISFTITHVSTDGGSTWLNFGNLPTVGVLPATGEYNLILDGKQLIITYAGIISEKVVYQKAGTSTVATALVGKWVLESTPATVELDFTEYYLRRRTNGSSYTIYYTKETNKKIEIGTAPGEFTQDFCTSYTITGDTLTFTGGQSDTWYPSASFKKYVFPPYTPTPLTANQWADGVITGGSPGEVWYSFSVTNETTYRLWWNDSGNNGGNGTKSLNVKVSGYYSDGTSITSFTDTDTAWTTAKSFIAASSGTVYIKVAPYTSGYTGTFGIVYSTGTERPVVIFNPPATPLTVDQWEDGEITADSGGEVWYSLAVTNETPYYVWWNDSGYNYNIDNSSGNRLVTLNVQVSAFNNDGTPVTGFSNTNDAWITPKSITPTLGDTVYLRVTPNNQNGTGTFGIVYSAANTRPAMSIGPSDKIALTADQWANGSIAPASDGEVWYSFDVTSDTTYRVWWNESGSNGNGLFKTLDVKVSAWYGSKGDNIFYDIDAGWAAAQTIAPTADGTVYLRVIPAASGNTGTFGIVYSAATTRPNVPFVPPEPPNPITLTANKWENGEITNSTREVWYSFTVTSGTYYLWSNDGGYNSGDGWSKTLPNAQVSVWYSDGTSIFTNANNNIWNTAGTISSTSNTTVYVRVTPYGEAIGTYGIVYSTANAKPFDVPSDTIALTAGQWADGEIPNGSDKFVWYSFPVTSGTYYYLWWNQAGGGYGDGSKTLGVTVRTYYSDGTAITTGDGWTTARTFTPNATQAGTVYVLVTPSTSSGTGTFGVVYNTANTRPMNPSGGIQLTENQWMNGEITSSNKEIWYSVPVGSGYTYIWWNDQGQGDNSKTLNVKVSGYYSNGNSLEGGFTDVDSAWSGYRQIYVAQAGTIYLKVTPYYNNDTGTFGIVYSSGTTRPTVP